MARAKGFLMVSASPLTRSSYHAGSDFERLREARNAQLAGGVPPAFESSMPTHAEQRVLPYRPEQLYELVAGVDRYPEFLPWCKAARITRREGDVFFADLVIAFKVFRERFSSKVTLHPADQDRRRVHQRPVPLSQQPLAVRAASGWVSDSTSTSTSSSSPRSCRT